MAIADDFAAIQKRRLELGHEAWPEKPVENIIPPRHQDDEIHIERIPICAAPLLSEQLTLGTFIRISEMSREEFTKRFPWYSSNYAYAVIDPASQKLRPCSEQEYALCIYDAQKSAEIDRRKPI